MCLGVLPSPLPPPSALTNPISIDKQTKERYVSLKLGPSFESSINGGGGGERHAAALDSGGRRAGARGRRAGAASATAREWLQRG